MKFKYLFVILSFVGSSQGWFWNNKEKQKKLAEKPDWNDLRVTFSPLGFSKLPLSELDAKKEGWKLHATCDARNYFAGRRYVLDGDRAVMLLYDSNGKIAGIQMGVPKSAVAPKKHPWISEGDYFVITAYFVDPATICNGTRPDSEYIGDRLLIQTGSSISSVMKIPYKQGELGGTGWVEGKCFYLMGKHYWYKISQNMKCEDFFPVFLLYNRGKLNGFGWNTIGNVESSRYEHPPARVLTRFFYPSTHPQCLANAGPLTTQHVYFDWPYNNFC